MRIAQTVRAKNLRAGERVLIMNSEGQPQYVRVVSIEPEYETGWFSIVFEGKEIQDIEGKTRVVVWR
jgi:hypothetical protein